MSFKYSNNLISMLMVDLVLAVNTVDTIDFYSSTALCKFSTHSLLLTGSFRPSIVRTYVIGWFGLNNSCSLKSLRKYVDPVSCVSIMLTHTTSMSLRYIHTVTTSFASTKWPTSVHNTYLDTFVLAYCCVVKQTNTHSRQLFGKTIPREKQQNHLKTHLYSMPFVPIVCSIRLQHWKRHLDIDSCRSKPPCWLF